MNRTEGEARNVTRTCLQSGQWSGNSINCTAVTCRRLDTQHGANLINQPSCNNTYGSKCVFTCKDGFVMKRKEGEARNVTRTCLQSGQWSGNSINCTGNPETNSSQKPTSSNNTKGGTSTLNYPGIVVGVFILFLLIVVAIFSLLRLNSSARTRNIDAEESMGFDNVAYRQPRSLPDDELGMKVLVSPQAKQQPDAGFSKPHIDPGGHCQTLDNANIENELNELDSPNCSNEPLRNRPPTSFPKCSKKLEAAFTCTGGKLFAQGGSDGKRISNESEGVSQSQAICPVEEDAIDRKTKFFSPRGIIACGGPSRKIATVYANKPDPRSDLIYLRFYVYSDRQDSKKCVELAEKKRFPDSKPAREKPFKMYKDNRMITVKLTDLEKGWNFYNTDDTQIYKYENARSGFRSIDACDFALKPEDGLDVNEFSCWVKFQQEDDDEEHSFYLNPGFTPLKRQSIRRSSAEGGQSDTTPSTSQYESSIDWDHYVSQLGSEPVTEEQIYQISPDVGRDWKDLLRRMSMKEKAIENLKEDFKNDKITEQCIQGLLKWKELDPKLGTVKNLAIALHDVGCLDALQTLRKQQEAKHQ
ncbi:uncharacterized protein LOC110040726 isoform X2 [Orbicella faveolata]|uniref:uncharacterized protein LOC110040726 isoform X2 n=1 Tax=Orbicella faveolata TaxID=48498 RepID=UPI0009E46AA4|nr:uncharacterized protein LOC110040726 isoform X2 [Orbicella faveolata]